MRRSSGRSSSASPSARPQAQRTCSSTMTSRSKSSADRSLAARNPVKSAPRSRPLLILNSATASCSLSPSTIIPSRSAKSAARTRSRLRERAASKAPGPSRRISSRTRSRVSAELAGPSAGMLTARRFAASHLVVLAIVQRTRCGAGLVARKPRISRNMATASVACWSIRPAGSHWRSALSSAGSAPLAFPISSRAGQVRS